MAQTGMSSRRVATAVAVLGALLFGAGLVLDLTRDSIYRHFYVINDASALLMFCVAAAYLRWGVRLASSRSGRVAGRVAQAYAVLSCLSQVTVWVRVAQRGDVWWALVFVIPALTASVLAIVAVQLALRGPRTDADSGPRTGAETEP
jgi:hypothetical protein